MHDVQLGILTHDQVLTHLLQQLCSTKLIKKSNLILLELIKSIKQIKIQLLIKILANFNS